MNLGLALLFSTLTVYFKDMNNLLNYILRILTFATPVVYPVSTLQPERHRRCCSGTRCSRCSPRTKAIITGPTPTAARSSPACCGRIVLW